MIRLRQYIYDLITERKRGIFAGVLKFFLWILSLIYGLCVALILWIYRSGIFKQHDLGRPVISVGNITWGGVGKTPLVALIAGFLTESGRDVVVLTRGYGADQKAESFGDEPSLLREAGMKVVTGADRLASAQRVLDEGAPDVFLLDDGFQQWRIRRDIEIVVIDTANPFGNGHLLPRGILREPLSSLARADIVVLSKSDRGRPQIPGILETVQKINSRALIVESVHQTVGVFDLRGAESNLRIDLLREKPVVGFCGIADPESFRISLQEAGAKVEKVFSFMDHHRYDAGDIQTILDFCREKKVFTVITTHKDAVKLREFLPLFGRDVQIVGLKIKQAIIKGQDQFYARISALRNR